MPTTELKDVHDPKAFKVGDRVTIARKVQSAKGWSDSWGGNEMDLTVGMIGVVMNSSTNGIEVQVAGKQDTWFYPSCALLMADGKQKELVPGGDTSVELKPKLKRVRAVKKGPWDNAPCTHLRFMLMGFFRDKLALVKPVGAESSVSFDVACTRCNQRMTLQAK